MSVGLYIKQDIPEMLEVVSIVSHVNAGKRGPVKITPHEPSDYAQRADR